ncbi:MAG: thiamine biosynthesis protein ApbE [Methylibium sp. NZG]|nr:MAG: thiamine biosynthesis protein ApbE [Methylibium sp. NZG]
MTAHRAPLPNGRWHFQHGPIDIVIGADGYAAAVAAAHGAAWQRFQTVLGELVDELPRLRAPIAGPCALQGVVARRMWHACGAVRAGFITPMAAVAGSVADELIGCYQREGVSRAWVNNGGDIALHLADGASLRVGLFADLARFDANAARDCLGVPRRGAGPPGGLAIDGAFEVASHRPVRGVATSGWRGRSFSLGIADSVTVLARTAAMADAAATVVANAVNLDDARIGRRPASELKDDSDLGTIPVTVDVPALDRESLQRALAAGARVAHDLQMRGLIWSAVLVCQGQVKAVDNCASAADAGNGAAALQRDAEPCHRALA